MYIPHVLDDLNHHILPRIAATPSTYDVTYDVTYFSSSAIPAVPLQDC